MEAIVKATMETIVEATMEAAVVGVGMEHTVRKSRNIRWQNRSPIF